MKLLKPLFLVFACLASLSGLNAQQTRVVTADKHNDYGLVYSLPLTGVNVRVKAIKETRIAGPYSQYAKKFLGMANNVVTENATLYRVAEISAYTVGLGDDADQYIMQLKPGAVTFIELNENGMLQSINCTSQPSSRLSQSSSREARKESSIPSVDDYLQYVDMDFISSQSSIKQAEMIASSLMDVRDSYLALTRGTADNQPSDGRQLELMLNSLRQQELALTRAFTGVSYTETEEKEFLYIPEKDGTEVLCRISDIEGFVSPDDYSGVPVYITTEVMLQGRIPTDEMGEERKMPKDAVVYVVPGVAKIEVSANDSSFFNQEMEFSQFGVKFGLNPLLFSDRKERSFARFNPVTGALVEIGIVKE